MGVIKRGILGGFSNKIANVVGSSWKGIATMRSLPLSVANPRTTLQVSNRNSFTYFSKLGSGLLGSVVQPLLNRDAKYMSGFNRFIKLNKDIYDNEGFAGWQPLAVISDGNLSAGISTANATIGASTVSITASTTLANPKDSATDLMYGAVIVYPSNATNLVDAKAYGAGGTVQRSNGSLSIPVPEIVAGYTYVIMLAYRSLDGTETSKTAVQVVAVS